MCTGDNPLTAATIAAEAGVDGYIAECKPEDKIEAIKKEQSLGKIVAMTGDGTNDAPALAQANVGIAMNSGTTAAKEAANMVDLDSDPTKILEVVEIGKNCWNNCKIFCNIICDQERTGGRKTGSYDGRWNKRCPGAGTGGCRTGNELRYAGS